MCFLFTLLARTMRSLQPRAAIQRPTMRSDAPLLSAVEGIEYSSAVKHKCRFSPSIQLLVRHLGTGYRAKSGHQQLMSFNRRTHKVCHVLG